MTRATTRPHLRLLVAALLLAGALPATGSSPENQTDCQDQLDVGLVIDRSGSMAGTRIDAAKAGSKTFLDTLGADDQSGLVSFQSSTTLDKSLDFNHAATKAAVDALAAGGGTSMAPAIDASHADILAHDRATARQVMVVLTDGFSNPDPPAAAATAKADGIEVYVIAVGDSVNTAELQAVASDPDSKYYHHAHTDAEVEGAYATIAERVQCDPPQECSSEPLDVGLVIDRSGSMAGARIDAAKAGSKKFLDKLSSADQSALVSFQSSTTLDKSLDFSHPTTKSAVDALAAGGGTSMQPAIAASHSDIMAHDRATARQVMVVLTDGFSSPDPPAAAAAAKADGIEVYVIAVGDSVNEAELKDVASDPDSKYYHHATDETGVEAAYDTVFSEIVCEEPDPECTGEPLDVGLVIDRSGSMYGARLDAAKAGSKKFLDKLSPVHDQSGLVSFQSSSTLDKSLDFSHPTTKSAVDALAAGGGTNMAPAIDLSHTDINAKSRVSARQVMVVLTDGFSSPDPPAAAAAAKADGIEVYVIAVGDSVNEAELKDVASDPDSKYYHHATTDVEVEAAYDTVFSRIKCEDPVCPPAGGIEVQQERRGLQADRQATPTLGSEAQPAPTLRPDTTVIVTPVVVDPTGWIDCVPDPECVGFAALAEVLGGLAGSASVNHVAVDGLPVVEARLCPDPTCIEVSVQTSQSEVQRTRLCLEPLPPVGDPVGPVKPIDPPADPVDPVDPVRPCVLLPRASPNEARPGDGTWLTVADQDAEVHAIELCLRVPRSPRTLEVGELDGDLRPTVFDEAFTQPTAY